MCGIVTALAFGKLPKEKEEARQILLRLLTTELLLETEDRGKDATGASILFEDGRFFGIKRGEEAGDFMSLFGESPDCFGSFLKIWREHKVQSRVYLGHCRQLTKGDKEDNANNHPIKVGNIVGIHNGIIRNDEIIFHYLKCERDGKVDSEAVLRLLAYGTNGGKEPFTLPVIQDVIRRMDGQFAVAAFNADNPYQVPMFRDGRPIEFTIVQSMQIVFACSEKKFWDNVLFRYERIVNYYNEMLKQDVMPSLLAKDNIRTESLEDDSAIIFNLDSEIKDKTTIKDLGDWSKMERGKVWLTMPTVTTPKTSTAVTTHTPITTFGQNRPFGVVTTGVTTKPDEKRRFFDKLRKKYVIKIGDRELKDNESIVLTVDKPMEEEVKSEATTLKAQQDIEANEGGIVENKDTKKETPEPETEKGHLNDFSSYIDALTDPAYLNSNVADVIEIDPRDITVVSNTPENDADDKAKTVEVKMKAIPPEIFSASIQAYENLPSEEKGYGSLADAIIDLDIKDIETVLKLPVLVLINKTFKAAFRKGYVNRALSHPVVLKDKEDVKKGRQEDYIKALKAITLIMASFYKEMPINVQKVALLQKILASTASPKITSDQVELLSNVLNLHEKAVVAPIAAVIDTAIFTSRETSKETLNESAADSTTI